jgi:hypothetical protein
MSESVQPSLLEQLRQRVQQDVAPGPMSANERLAAFGRGVLSSRGSLLDNLSAGLAGQQQAEAARRAENLKTTEAEGTLAYRDAQMRLEEAKQRYEQDPSNPRNALYLAQAQQALNANRPQYQIIGTNAQGDAVVADMRDPNNTRVLQGVRPTRSEVADIAAAGRNRAAAERAADNDVRNLQAEINAGRSRQPTGGFEQYREERVQHHMRRLGAGAGAGTPEPEAGPRQGPSQRFQYQPPQ